MSVFHKLLLMNDDVMVNMLMLELFNRTPLAFHWSCHVCFIVLLILSLIFQKLRVWLSDTIGKLDSGQAQMTPTDIGASMKCY